MAGAFQHNVLFDNLTVFQHLQYFAAIKGMEASKVDAACRDMIREVGLVEKVGIGLVIAALTKRTSPAVGSRIASLLLVCILARPTRHLSS